MKNLYRGIWADRLENGEELPVGGSIFSDGLTIKMQLNFNELNGQLENYQSPQKVTGLYEENKKGVTSWLSQVGSKIDPYIFFVAITIQRKVQVVMDVNPESPPSELERRARFKDDRVKLTELRGVAMCAEQAALGQYLFQNVFQPGYSSSYMNGVETEEPRGELEVHSFIVVKDPRSRTYVFDIARPRSGNNLPRVLEPDVPMKYESFRNTKNLLVGATEVLQGGRLYFGVGNPWLEQETQIAQP